jgi:hypothetical protein
MRVLVDCTDMRVLVDCTDMRVLVDCTNVCITVARAGTVGLLPARTPPLNIAAAPRAPAVVPPPIVVSAPAENVPCPPASPTTITGVRAQADDVST